MNMQTRMWPVILRQGIINKTLSRGNKGTKLEIPYTCVVCRNEERKKMNYEWKYCFGKLGKEVPCVSDTLILDRNVILLYNWGCWPTFKSRSVIDNETSVFSDECYLNASIKINYVKRVNKLVLLYVLG